MKEDPMAIRFLMDRKNFNPAADGNPQIEELDERTRKYLDDSTTSGTWHGDPVFELSWVGCVLRMGERNMYDDSDFYAIVWDAAKGAPRQVEYASTRGWTYANGASVDATDEVKAAYEAWETARAEDRRVAREAYEAALPTVGKTVKVIKGRKIPKGTTGEVVWFGDDKYNSTQWNPRYRIAIMINGNRVFTSADNVEVV